MASENANPRSLQEITVKKFIDDYLLRIDLDADYQREKIWSTKQQEELIDSIAKDIDIPKIYLVKAKNNKQFDFECIDGKQRMSTLSMFFKPEPNESSPLSLRLLQKPYTYKQLKSEHPTVAKKIEEYKLSFCIYQPLDDEFIKEIFRRLQLGIRLNSGEMLKTRSGTIRDFVYKDIGKVRWTPKIGQEPKVVFIDKLHGLTDFIKRRFRCNANSTVLSSKPKLSLKLLAAR